MSMQITASSSLIAMQNSPSVDTKATANAALAVPFSARVGSTTYSGDVLHFNGEYEGSVSNLFGVKTAAQTVDSVETRLANLIDFFA